MPDVQWLGFDGGPVEWADPGLDSFCLVLRESAETPACVANDDCMALVFNRSSAELSARLPALDRGCAWLRVLDTARPEAPRTLCSDLLQPVSPESIVAFEAGAGP